MSTDPVENYEVTRIQRHLLVSIENDRFGAPTRNTKRAIENCRFGKLGYRPIPFENVLTILVSIFHLLRGERKGIESVCLT